MSIYDAPELYDEQYRGYRDDIPHYLRLAADFGGPVLELGAGTGRLGLALGAAGHSVVGIESSGRMLARGMENVAGEGLEERVRLQEGDMRSIRLGRRFPLVIAGFNTLMHLFGLADQDAALATAAAHLEVGGAFAFDLFTPRFGATGVVRREPEWSRLGGADGDLFLVQEHDPHSQTIVSRYYLDTVGPDGLLRRRTATLRQRYYTRFELERALRQAGFTRVRFYGGFDGSPYTAESKHIVGVARI